MENIEQQQEENITTTEATQARHEPKQTKLKSQFISSGSSILVIESTSDKILLTAGQVTLFLMVATDTPRNEMKESFSYNKPMVISDKLVEWRKVNTIDEADIVSFLRNVVLLTTSTSVTLALPQARFPNQVKQIAIDLKTYSDWFVDVDKKLKIKITDSDLLTNDVSLKFDKLEKEISNNEDTKKYDPYDYDQLFTNAIELPSGEQTVDSNVSGIKLDTYENIELDAGQPNYKRIWVNKFNELTAMMKVDNQNGGNRTKDLLDLHSKLSIKNLYLVCLFKEVREIFDAMHGTLMLTFRMDAAEMEKIYTLGNWFLSTYKTFVLSNQPISSKLQQMVTAPPILSGNARMYNSAELFVQDRDNGYLSYFNVNDDLLHLIPSYCFYDPRSLLTTKALTRAKALHLLDVDLIQVLTEMRLHPQVKLSSLVPTLPSYYQLLEPHFHGISLTQWRLDNQLLISKSESYMTTSVYEGSSTYPNCKLTLVNATTKQKVVLTIHGCVFDVDKFNTLFGKGEASIIITKVTFLIGFSLSRMGNEDFRLYKRFLVETNMNKGEEDLIVCNLSIVDYSLFEYFATLKRLRAAYNEVKFTNPPVFISGRGTFKSTFLRLFKKYLPNLQTLESDELYLAASPSYYDNMMAWISKNKTAGRDVLYSTLSKVFYNPMVNDLYSSIRQSNKLLFRPIIFVHNTAEATWFSPERYGIGIQRMVPSDVMSEVRRLYKGTDPFVENVIADVYDSLTMNNTSIKPLHIYSLYFDDSFGKLNEQFFDLDRDELIRLGLPVVDVPESEDEE